jgi:HAD superfamily hydrolase (TIGR01509 family)
MRSRQACWAPRTACGAAPNDPWFRKSTPGASVHSPASEEGIADYRRPMDPAPRQLPPPAALVFDLDGTLVDTVPTRIRAWSGVFAEFGIPSTQKQLAPLIGSDGRRLAREVASAARRRLQPGEDEAIDRRSGEIHGELNRDPQPLPGARELLAELDRRGIAWVIATSSRREQVGGSVAALRLPREPRIVDGSHVENAKPAPDLLLRAAGELDVPRGKTWCIGDSTWDMAAAAAAGMPAIAVMAGAAVDAAALRAAGARRVVDTLTEIGALLG